MQFLTNFFLQSILVTLIQSSLNQLQLVNSQITRQSINLEISNEWYGGFSGKIIIPITEDIPYGWLVEVKFEWPVKQIEIFEADVVVASNQGYIWVLKNKEFNGNLKQHRQKLEMIIIVTYANAQLIKVPAVSFEFIKIYENKNFYESFLAYYDIESSVAVWAAQEDMSVAEQAKNLKDVLNELEAIIPFEELAPPTRKPSGIVLPPEDPPELGNFQYTKHNLTRVLELSVLFFQAQKSGRLPEDNMVLWRQDSGLQDGFRESVDLSGGYYVNGGYVKYAFPIAYTMQTLAWGIYENYEVLYKNQKLFNEYLDILAHGAAYLINCHTEEFVFYAQVFDFESDNSYWGRARNVPYPKKIFKLTVDNPGSEVVAEASSALSLCYLLFQKAKYEKISYDMLKTHAIQLFDFGHQHKANYHDSIPDAASSFKSWSGYEDELAWAAIWLYNVTENQEYLNLAQFYESIMSTKTKVQEYSWDDKRIAVKLKLYQILQKFDAETMFFQIDLQKFCHYFEPESVGKKVVFTPDGSIYLSEWGPLRLALNSLFVCLLFDFDRYKAISFRQLQYVLGNNSKNYSYLVGYGQNYPQKVFHKGASCPLTGKCDWGYKEKLGNQPNPQILNGALVSGPDEFDNFKDSRENWKQNGVSITYNAGLTSICLALFEYQKTLTEEDLKREKFDIPFSPDYENVLAKSLLFYEAQRAGKLDEYNRISWKKFDTAMEDGQDHNVDLTGGYFDAGDYMKFNFPMAFTLTTISWSMIRYTEAYNETKQLFIATDMIKHGTEYLMRSWSDDGTNQMLFGQVGLGDIDHEKWNSPQHIDSSEGRRPSFKLDPENPGSDLAGETAAALASAALVYEKLNLSAHSETLLKYAKQIYEFGNEYRGVYHESIPDAAKFYKSEGFLDELAWAAIWLYKATNEVSYFNSAVGKFTEYLDSMDDKYYVPYSYFWNDKSLGVAMLLYEEHLVKFEDEISAWRNRTLKTFVDANGNEKLLKPPISILRILKYEKYIDRYCEFTRNSAKKTPKGLLYLRPNTDYSEL